MPETPRKTHYVVALYEGNTISDCCIIAATTDPELVALALAKYNAGLMRSPRITLEGSAMEAKQ